MNVVLTAAEAAKKFGVSPQLITWLCRDSDSRRAPLSPFVVRRSPLLLKDTAEMRSAFDRRKKVGRPKKPRNIIDKKSAQREKAI